MSETPGLQPEAWQWVQGPILPEGGRVYPGADQGGDHCAQQTWGHQENDQKGHDWGQGGPLD